jgi:hypothetical protein
LLGTERGSNLHKEDSAAPVGLAMTVTMITLSVRKFPFLIEIIPLFLPLNETPRSQIPRPANKKAGTGKLSRRKVPMDQALSLPLSDQEIGCKPQHLARRAWSRDLALPPAILFWDFP